jgi:hypothetical protein
LKRRKEKKRRRKEEEEQRKKSHDRLREVEEKQGRPNVFYGLKKILKLSLFLIKKIILQIY